jgi:hypothetical protein
VVAQGMRQRRACGAGWPATGQVRLVADGGRRADGRQGVFDLDRFRAAGGRRVWAD